jgi:hypothetical protein
VFCAEPIRPKDCGCAIPKAEGGEMIYHFECYIRLAVGSRAHQQRKCSCYGGTGQDAPGQTRREAAMAAFDYWVRYGRE